MLAYETAVGEFRRAELTRDVFANINTATQMSVAMLPAHCDVSIRTGEALFEIDERDTREWHVTAGNARVTAHASSFSVRAVDAGQVDILVRSGQVDIKTVDASAARAHRLHGPVSSAPTIRSHMTLPAEVIAHVDETGKVSMRVFDAAEVARLLEWTTGHLRFHGETLGQAVAEFNRYNEEKLLIEDRKLRAVTIGGRFRSTDPEAFVAALAKIGIAKPAPEPTYAARNGSRPRVIRLVSAQGDLR